MNKKQKKHVCDARFRGRKGMLFCTWKMRKKGKIGRNSFDNIAGG